MIPGRQIWHGGRLTRCGKAPRNRISAPICRPPALANITSRATRGREREREMSLFLCRPLSGQSVVAAAAAVAVVIRGDRVKGNFSFAAKFGVRPYLLLSLE